MINVRQKISRIALYVLLGTYLGVGVFLNLCYVFDAPGLHTLWRSLSYIVEIIIGLSGFTAAYFLLKARAKVKKPSVERTVLLLVGLTALFFALGWLMTGIIEKTAGDEPFTHSTLSLANIVSPVTMLAAAATGVAAIVVLIVNTYAILSRTQLLASVLISVGVLLVFGVLFLTSVVDIRLTGVMKVAAIFLSAVCLGALVGTAFVVMAFGRGLGRAYWLHLALGFMLVALSGLAAFFCYAVGGRWVGLTLLGFTAAMAFWGLAGHRRGRMP